MAYSQEILSPREEALPAIPGEPEWLSALRRKALDIYRTSRPEPNPLYSKYAEISRFEDTGLVPGTFPAEGGKVPAALSDLLEPGLVSLQSGNSRYTLKQLPDGIEFMSIERAILEKSEWLSELFAAKGLQPAHDMYVALNTAMLNGGYILHIPKHLNAPPIHLVYVEEEPGHARFHQNIVIVDEGSNASVIEEIVSSYNFTERSLYSEVTDVMLGEGSSMYYTSLQNMSSSGVFLSSRRCLAGKGSSMHWISSYMGAAVTRSRADTVFNGRGSSTEDYEILFGNGQQRFDVVTDLHHQAQDTSGRIVVRSVLRENARSLLRGMIRIGEKASNTSSYLAEHGMLLSRDARCDAIPGLEILTNGVKATHSASVSQLDADQLYYLQTRGLEKDEAEKLMVLGFFDPVISRIPIDTVRDKLRFLIEDKWNKVISLKASRHMDEIEFEKYVKDQISTSSSIFEGHYKYR